ncbi:NAD(P)/FAD-dependent oxidoreductase [Gemmatimonadota bacterium]
MTVLRHEVVVIGAGPAGSHTAKRLAECGHDVLLMDAGREPAENVACSGIVGCEAFEILDLPATSVVDTVSQARFFSPSKEEVLYQPPQPMARVVDRRIFDGALAERAENAGAVLMRDCKALSLERTPGGIKLAVRNGGPGSVEARAVVLATGHRRTLHGEAGLGSHPGHTAGIGAELPFADLDSAELYFGNGVAPGFFAWAVPAGPGRARLGVLAAADARALFTKFLRSEEIRPRLRVSDWQEALAMAKGRGLGQGVVDPSYGDRVLGVGEAVGQIKTTTLGGIYYGLLGAEIAAEVLSDGLKEDRLQAPHLARYQKAWTRRLGDEIEAGLEVQRLAQEMSDAEINTLFESLNNGMAQAVKQVVKFDWHRPALKVIMKKALRRVVDRAI